MLPLGQGQPTQCLLAIDGNCLGYRHYATAEAKFIASGPPPTDAPSLPAVVPYAIHELLLKLVSNFWATRVVVCWDSKGSWERRLAIYSGYKSKRNEKRTPEDEISRAHYKRQLLAAQTFLFTLGVDQCAAPGWEADDFLAWHAIHTPKDVRVILVTTDKDMLPLVEPNVGVFDPFKPRLISWQNYLAEVGMPRERFLDYLAMIGDASDSIPGVPLVGEKTAEKWLADYASVEAIIEAAQQHREGFTTKKGELTKAAANICAGMDVVTRNRKLMDLRWTAGVSAIPIRRGLWDPVMAYRIAEWYAMRPIVEAFGSSESVFGELWRQSRQHAPTA